MNVNKLKESHSEFVNFIVSNLSLLSAFDQTAYQIFYGNKNTKLPTIYNHKPYWGVDKKAAILHFHGAKPTTFSSKQALINLPYMHEKLYRKNPEAYDFYLKIFRTYCSEVEYDSESLEKLKCGVYPKTKQKRTPLLFRMMHRLSKKYKQFKVCK